MAGAGQRGGVGVGPRRLLWLTRGAGSRRLRRSMAGLRRLVRGVYTGPRRLLFGPGPRPEGRGPGHTGKDLSRTRSRWHCAPVVGPRRRVTCQVGGSKCFTGTRSGLGRVSSCCVPVRLAQKQSGQTLLYLSMPPSLPTKRSNRLTAPPTPLPWCRMLRPLLCSFRIPLLHSFACGCRGPRTIRPLRFGGRRRGPRRLPTASRAPSSLSQASPWGSLAGALGLLRALQARPSASSLPP